MLECFSTEKQGKKFPQNTTGEIPMSYDTQDSQKLQHQIKRFAGRITKDLSKLKKKFLSQVLFGIQASRDVKLSNIARSLKEDITRFVTLLFFCMLFFIL